MSDNDRFDGPPHADKSDESSSLRYRYRPEVGPHPPLIFTGGDLGLGDGEPWIDLATVTGQRYVCHSVEAVLRVIDLFQEPGRTSLLAGAAIHYGLSPPALLGPQQ